MSEVKGETHLPLYHNKAYLSTDARALKMIKSCRRMHHIVCYLFLVYDPSDNLCKTKSLINLKRRANSSVNVN